MGIFRTIAEMFGFPSNTNDQKLQKKIESTQNIDLLIGYLHDSDPKVRMTAIEVMGRLKDSRALKPLVLALMDKDWIVRRTAADSLGDMNSSLAVEPLMSSLLEDENSIVRIAAVYALGKIRDFRAVSALITALNKDSYSGVREAAATMLGEWKHPETIRWLIYALRDEQHWEVRDRVALALVKIGTPALESLLDALHHYDLQVQKNAIYILGKLKDFRAVKPLIEILGDKDSHLRNDAAFAFRNITGEDFGEDQTQWQYWREQRKPK